MRTHFTRGMGIIELVVGIALMLIVFIALFGVLRLSIELSRIAKAKAVATELANSQMEALRALSYAALGTTGGTPSGAIAQTATSTVGGAPYIVRTMLSYYDDPADGIGESDADHVPQDYKKARVTVSYTLPNRIGSVTLSSNFAAPDTTP